jgi:(2Fe-2S) ferredoxin
MNKLLLGILMLSLSGCVFIVKDGDKEKYYGVKEDQGREIVQQVTARQEEVKDKPALINIK